jgi:hypothetical protein
MGIELLLIISVLAWLGIFFYLLALHLQQRKLVKAMARLRETSESLKRDRDA